MLQLLNAGVQVNHSRVGLWPFAAMWVVKRSCHRNLTCSCGLGLSRHQVFVEGLCSQLGRHSRIDREGSDAETGSEELLASTKTLRRKCTTTSSCSQFDLSPATDRLIARDLCFEVRSQQSAFEQVHNIPG